MRRIRTIPVLLLSKDGLVKTTSFSKPRYLGDPINAVKIFNEKMADELILLDIKATANSHIQFKLIEEIASEAFMPIAYGGGLTSLEQCARIFAAGIERVVVNAAAVENPSLIREVAERYGTQSIVASIDVRKDLWNRSWCWVRSATKKTRLTSVQLAKRCEALGAGELFVTSVAREGSFDGFDIELTRIVADSVSIPVIAHGGAASTADFVQAVNCGCASAVAAGSMFVFAGKGEGVLINYPTQQQLIAEFWEHCVL
jgi:imidazole glycerol-phosphate synthase subunit HisF